MYYSAKVQVIMEPDEKGKQKKVTENYLVEAVSVTDAEVIVTKYYAGTMQEFRVKSVSETNILGILNKDSN